MKKILLLILKISIYCFSLILICCGITGIILCFFSQNAFTLIACMLFGILFLTGGIRLLYTIFRRINKKDIDVNSSNSTLYYADCKNIEAAKSKNTPPNITEPQVTNIVSNPASSNQLSKQTAAEQLQSTQKHLEYIETEQTVYRADNKAISDEEIPYLIQVGYEEALSKKGLYNGQVLDLSFMQKRDKNKKEYTTIPTYSELSSIAYEESYVNLNEILFLNYINGLPIENPLIAQKWYYDYNLNYSKTIKKLIANGLLSVNHTCVDKMNVVELKNVLKAFNLPLSGRKEELIKRIYKNISQTDIDKYFNGTKFFTATDKGKELIKNKTT